MQIPNWLANFTHAGNGMSASNLDNFVSGGGYAPTLGDAARAIGHDMMTHFRAGQTPLSSPGAATAPGMTPAPAPAPIAPPAVVPIQAAPAPAAFTPTGAPAQPTDLASILAAIGHGVVPHLPQGVPLSKVAIHFAPPAPPQQ